MMNPTQPSGTSHTFSVTKAAHSLARETLRKAVNSGQHNTHGVAYNAEANKAIENFVADNARQGASKK